MTRVVGNLMSGHDVEELPVAVVLKVRAVERLVPVEAPCYPPRVLEHPPEWDGVSKWV